MFRQYHILLIGVLSILMTLWSLTQVVLTLDRNGDCILVHVWWNVLLLCYWTHLTHSPSPYVYYPFGVGHRSCIGRVFAVVSCAVILTSDSSTNLTSCFLETDGGKGCVGPPAKDIQPVSARELLLQNGNWLRTYGACRRAPLPLVSSIVQLKIIIIELLKHKDTFLRHCYNAH